MGAYGRNAWFLNPPEPNQRRGRYVLEAATQIFAPVEAGTDVDVNGQRTLTLCDTETAPVQGKHGILIYENPFSVAPGFDPVSYGYGDFHIAPAGASAQLVSGVGIKFRLKNTADEVLMLQQDYPAFVMVDGLGATPTLGVDDYIGPGPGNSTDGFWQPTDAAHAWAIVTAVYDTDELDAELIFG